MKVLITSSRMPFALAMVRKLAAEGREIYAADDHVLSPGNHSKYLAGHFVYPSPRSDTAAFLAELERIVQKHEIDVDAVGGDSARGERVALGGEALLIGLDAGIPDLQSGHGWEYAG
jgi:hypothetical protein